ncbi:hypothetical protein KVR01_005958 [Diaporthe batatas]|uniref:uncharacterized protein n=1 Tax=Diaporthe batatas TaxID=748121 RepID=UPI001D0553D5|nr:uncharacterized protein KVR01_005958 [Diaporthe batatas]KAG8164040.1 hypothetical protein KVR01_005958 [Diaporthe batatas]
MAPQTRKLNKPLTCFYCNRRSTTKYDGSMRRFECSNCNATNHLDTKGDITDVPAAKSSTVPQPAQFAIRRDHSSTSSQVFCDKCLQNQHLFISSLAQYFPEDPEDPEYAEREKNYYKFYKGLMKRYPQCCADCEPKVREQLAKAAYTAKTDHLRRMLDRTAKIRVVTTNSPVYYCQSVGRWLWVASLIFQLLWHLCLTSKGLADYGRRARDNSWPMLSMRIVAGFLGFLPSPGQLLKWSFWTSAISIWWNPRWVDTFKSNTKHLVGISNYYCYQALIFALKLAATLLVSPLSNMQGPALASRVTAHVWMAVSIMYLYYAANKMIRVDHTPLWTTKASSIGANPAAPPPMTPSETRENEEKSMATILDEILHEPTQNSQPRRQSLMSQFSDTESPDLVRALPGTSAYNPNLRPLAPNPFANSPVKRPQSSGVGLSSLSLSDSPRAGTQGAVEYYSPTMEWTPTQSKYRAFNTYKPGESETRKFGETPVNDQPGAFWAKVPPAPKAPAQRFLSQQNTPVLRRSPRIAQSPITFQGTQKSTLGAQRADAPPATIFAEPRLRPAQPRDERDDLLDKFATSFTLASDQNDEPPAGDSRVGSNVSTSGQPPQRSTSIFKHAFLYLVCSAFLAILAARAYKDFGYLGKLVSIRGR